MPVIDAIASPNVYLSLFLFVVAMGVFWVKMHLMRKEIHLLVETLPAVIDQQVAHEVEELRQEQRETRARLMLCEEKLGLNGGC
jgi:hypothetical protein